VVVSDGDTYERVVQKLAKDVKLIKSEIKARGGFR
jgi:hypothetical protein